MDTMTTATTQYLHRPEGRLAFDVQGPNGDGPVILAVPGLGDLRQTYRHVVPQLLEAGITVVTLDLRGHGESDSSFSEFDDEALASDIVALIDHLDRSVIIMGNSMASGAAVIASAERPSAIDGLVLVGPFVRNRAMPFGMATMFRLALWRPWGKSVWRMFHRRLFIARVPSDYEAYVNRLMTSLARPGAWKALQRTARTSHAPAEARIDEVRAPAFVVMGTDDPDFPSASEEAEWIAGRLNAQLQLVTGAGHYPHAEFPELVGPSVVEFAQGLARA